ncbi:hypothetical protein K432DRAFT_437074 [Lepidopterella palustris CBS 459.81]|uniref:Rhodopsin domain-containing protein n=1 Tax=Lepidopterella palustris CBS 459.81 TaxID=1314670 RepID=A0A8E2E397_9PEZI|nr:hypothetical protein K432DRAFT_437074 [Lepidopterella palustris CBS 459.81]
MADNPSLRPPDVSTAPKMLAVHSFLLAIVLILYAARIYTRLQPSPHMGWDDYTISVSVVLATTRLGLIAGACAHGLGRHTIYVAPEEASVAFHLIVIAMAMWCWSVAFVKVSMACMLLRIKNTPGWQWFLWLGILIQIGTAIAANTTQLTYCKPLRSLWSFDPNAVCWTTKNSQAAAYTTSIINIIIDIMLSLLPITFIRLMHRPLRERLVLALLMSLGLFASAAAIIKTTFIKDFGPSTDNLYNYSNLLMWNTIEELIGIIAACIPTLKSPFERVLGHLGLMSSRGETRTAYGERRSNLGYLQYGDTTSFQMRSLRKSNALGKGADAVSEESILPTRVIKEADMTITKTTEVALVEEMKDQDSVRGAEAGNVWKAV